MLQILFWACVALLLHTHVGYPLILTALSRRRRNATAALPAPALADPPAVTLIVAAHDEEAVIARKVADALALEYPRERLQVVVACDGCSDRTAELAREAGADLVLELERRGKVAAQNEAVMAAEGEILAFSDANSYWAPDALMRLVERLADRDVGYVCGAVELEAGEGGENQEGVYWRYEMAVRSMESRPGGDHRRQRRHLRGAPRRVRVPGAVGAGTTWRCPRRWPRPACDRSTSPRRMPGELMAPDRRRRVRAQAPDDGPHLGRAAALGPAQPRGYRPLYAYEVFSHRLLRYAQPVPAHARLRLQPGAARQRLGLRARR